MDANITKKEARTLVALLRSLDVTQKDIEYIASRFETVLDLKRLPKISPFSKKRTKEYRELASSAGCKDPEALQVRKDGTIVVTLYEVFGTQRLVAGTKSFDYLNCAMLEIDINHRNCTTAIRFNE